MQVLRVRAGAHGLTGSSPLICPCMATHSQCAPDCSTRLQARPSPGLTARSRHLSRLQPLSCAETYRFVRAFRAKRSTATWNGTDPSAPFPQKKKVPKTKCSDECMLDVATERTTLAAWERMLGSSIVRVDRAFLCDRKRGGEKGENVLPVVG